MDRRRLQAGGSEKGEVIMQKKERKRRYTSEPFVNPDFVLPKEGFVRLPVVLKILGISKCVFYAGIKEGKYPRQIKFGPRTSVWRVEDIREVIDRYKDA